MAPFVLLVLAAFVTAAPLTTATSRGQGQAPLIPLAGGKDGVNYTRGTAKTAIILKGQLRAFEVIWEINKRNYFSKIPGGFDLFFVGPGDGDEYFERAKDTLHGIPELVSSFEYRTEVGSTSCDPEARNRSLTVDRNTLMLDLNYFNMWHPAKHCMRCLHFQLQYMQAEEAVDLVRKEEHKRGMNYETVILTRPDVLYLDGNPVDRTIDGEYYENPCNHDMSSVFARNSMDRYFQGLKGDDSILCKGIDSAPVLPVPMFKVVRINLEKKCLYGSALGPACDSSFVNSFTGFEALESKVQLMAQKHGLTYFLNPTNVPQGPSECMPPKNTGDPANSNSHYQISPESLEGHCLQVETKGLECLKLHGVPKFDPNTFGGYCTAFDQHCKTHERKERLLSDHGTLRDARFTSWN